MPTYEYLCESCGHRFEKFQLINEAPVDTCPNCNGKGKVKRLMGAGAGFLFKGSGFHSTDYRGASCDGPSCSTGSCPTCPTCSDGACDL